MSPWSPVSFPPLPSLLVPFQDARKWKPQEWQKSAPKNQKNEVWAFSSSAELNWGTLKEPHGLRVFSSLPSPRGNSQKQKIKEGSCVFVAYRQERRPCGSWQDLTGESGPWKLFGMWLHSVWEMRNEYIPDILSLPTAQGQVGHMSGFPLTALDGRPGDIPACHCCLSITAL